ncbi:MAG TPA: hypothetical protein VMV49_09895 [Candidatus Deferrimicrobium sp.]|nr:hypothetical protein [Candidatus Deferrimicrobium sp.]
MPIDCLDCVRKKNFRKGMDCPVNDKYRQNHDTCDFKKTEEEFEEELNKDNKMLCPKHGWQRGWRTSRPIAGSSAPQYWFCPVKGCIVRRRGE